jgi:hypothetical protein
MPTARYIDSLKNPRIPGFEWQEPEDDGDRKIFRHILEQGFQSICIQPEEGVDGYSFTVGLYLNFLHPEILMMGVSDDLAHAGFWRILNLIEAGTLLKPGDERADIFNLSHPVRFVPVDQKYYLDYVGYAHWFYRSLFFKPPVVVQKFPILQAIWADKDGYYPDDPYCDATARRVQTLVEIPIPPQ